jgi:hypothetical protein
MQNFSAKLFGLKRIPTHLFCNCNFQIFSYFNIFLTRVEFGWKSLLKDHISLFLTLKLSEMESLIETKTVCLNFSIHCRVWNLKEMCMSNFLSGKSAGCFLCFNPEVPTPTLCTVLRIRDILVRIRIRTSD